MSTQLVSHLNVLFEEKSDADAVISMSADVEAEIVGYLKVEGFKMLN